MGVLNWIMVGVLALSVVNYYQPIFHHPWAEGHYERAGIKRAFIPAMSVFSMLGVWSLANMFATGPRKIRWSGYSALYIAAHIFRQTRMRLAGILAVLFCLALYKKQFTRLTISLMLLGLGAMAINSMLQTDVLSSNIAVTREEISEKKGSWGGRLVFAQEISKELNDSPLFILSGTGGSAIRPYAGAYDSISKSRFSQYYILGKQSDLGYLNWLKNFGLIGIAWLMFFFHGAWKYFRKAIAHKDQNEGLALFGGFYFLFVAGTFVTLNHFVIADKILPVMLAAAILVRLDFGWKEGT